MPFVLCRVDDRLVHGQVVVGWGQPLHAERIVLVDDAVAASDWERDLYRLATPAHLALEILDTTEAARRLAELARDARRTVLLTGDLGTMRALHEADPQAVHAINLGGIHAGPGRRQRLPYLFLSDAEVAEVQALVRSGAEVSAQDVPTAAPVRPEVLGS